jgi:hypothetical protein
LAACTATLVACTTPGAQSGGPGGTTTTATGTTAAASPAFAASPAAAAPSLPPGTAWLEDGQVEPGTYWFAGFEPALELEIGSAGWEVGHFHDTVFDLFKNGDFPAVGFGRFSEVYGAEGAARSTTDAAAVVAALEANPNLTTTRVGPASISGLTGWTIDVRAEQEQTPLFRAADGQFKFDPGFVGRYHVLDVPGGAIEVWVAAREGGLDAAVEATQPIIDGLRVLG